MYKFWGSRGGKEFTLTLDPSIAGRIFIHVSLKIKVTLALNKKRLLNIRKMFDKYLSFNFVTD